MLIHQFGSLVNSPLPLTISPYWLTECKTSSYSLLILLCWFICMLVCVDSSVLLFNWSISTPRNYCWFTSKLSCVNPPHSVPTTKHLLPGETRGLMADLTTRWNLQPFASPRLRRTQGRHSISTNLTGWSWSWPPEHQQTPPLPPSSVGSVQWPWERPVGTWSCTSLAPSASAPGSWMLAPSLSGEPKRGRQGCSVHQSLVNILHVKMHDGYIRVKSNSSNQR